jgi:hypothetical protein
MHIHQINGMGVTGRHRLGLWTAFTIRMRPMLYAVVDDGNDVHFADIIASVVPCVPLPDVRPCCGRHWQ